MDKLLVGIILVFAVYSVAVTHKLGILEGKKSAWASVSSQVEQGTLDLKGD